jgi:hypothetical protein
MDTLKDWAIGLHLPLRIDLSRTPLFTWDSPRYLMVERGGRNRGRAGYHKSCSSCSYLARQP